MLIALAGRMHSGKTELANICLNKGFKIIKFADGLKNLICELINVDRCFIESNKDKIIKYSISYDVLSDRLDLDKSIIISVRKNNIFNSIREIMQFIGTDIIREFKPEWHIERLKENMKVDVDYCIDDLRFKNEKFFMSSVLGESWYVMRPNNFNVSNHKSEVDLNWNDFGNNIIINDVNIELFKSRWEKYLESTKDDHCDIFGFVSKTALRHYLYNNINNINLSTQYIADIHNCSRDKIIWWCNRLLVPIKRNKYITNNKSFLVPTKEASYYAGLLAADGCVKKSGRSKYKYVIDFGSIDRVLVEGFRDYIGTNKPIYTSTSSGYGSKKTFYYCVCTDPFILQNLKYWNLQPNKSMNEQVPSIIDNDEDCIKQWIVGLTDGGGSVFISGKSLGITMLSSKSVINFIYKFIPIKGTKMRHKDTNLYELRWYNFKAVDVFNWLSPEIYLDRKWSKINQFLEFNTKRTTKQYNILEEKKWQLKNIP